MKTPHSYNLVIVESPAKCKKIEGFLGSGYKCVASYGHLRELPSLKNIDIENNFRPSFTITSSKLKNVQKLKPLIKDASKVILATDDDREGEAIAWHICDIFQLDVSSTPRIAFHEITRDAVLRAVNNPRCVNMDLVHAQLSRQMLDVIVGFSVSPVLWKHISHTSLSAGRCQSPALKLIYENQLEIDNAETTSDYATSGYINVGGRAIRFVLNRDMTSDHEVTEYYDQLSEFDLMYHCKEPRTVEREPPKPLNTSVLQQHASNELRMSPKECMQSCQRLYEAGHITYMRTENQQYSAEFLDKCKPYIIGVYGDDFVSHDKIQELTNDGSNPHEAIRPTCISTSTLSADDFTNREIRLYKLIHRRTLQSCMAAATIQTVEATTTAPDDCQFVCKREKVVFPGWKVLDSDKKDTLQDNEFNILASTPDCLVNYTTIESSYRITKTKQHYTEARLVQLLEQKGIGRPSTFSSIVEKIQDRGYVKKTNVSGHTRQVTDFTMDREGSIVEIVHGKEFGAEKNKLVIQSLGISVIELLDTHFQELFAYDYTRDMETQLDIIAGGEATDWKSMLSTYYTNITRLLTDMKSTHSGEKIEYKIDEHHTYLFGKNGPVVKCTQGDAVSFKSVRADVDVKKIENGGYSLEEVLATPKPDDCGLGEYDGHAITLKNGRYGLYASWGAESIQLKSLGNRPIENISLEEVVSIIQTTKESTRKISDTLCIKTSKRGPYLFYKTKDMKKPGFFSLKDCPYDYFHCDLGELSAWIFKVFSVV